MVDTEVLVWHTIKEIHFSCPYFSNAGRGLKIVCILYSDMTMLEAIPVNLQATILFVVSLFGIGIVTTRAVASIPALIDDLPPSLLRWDCLRHDHRYRPLLPPPPRAPYSTASPHKRAKPQISDHHLYHLIQPH